MLPSDLPGVALVSLEADSQSSRFGGAGLAVPSRTRPRWERAVWLLRANSTIIGAFVGSRAIVAVGAVYLHEVRWPRGFFGRHQFHHLFGVLASWDGVWYMRVASRGYLLVPGRQSDPAFFPLYPALLRLGRLAGMSYAVTGILISNLALLVAALAMAELGRRYLGRARARRSAVLLVLFPMGFVFSMVYPESLVLAAMALAMLSALTGRWSLTAIFVAIAALARPEGVFIVIPLVALASRDWRSLGFSDRLQRVLAVAAGPVMLALFPLYLWRTIDDPFAWFQAQLAWGRSFHLRGLLLAATTFPHQVKVHPFLSLDLIFLVVYLFALLCAARAGIPRSWLLAGAAILLLPLGSGSLESESRFGLLALPVYWGLGSLPPATVRALTAAFSILLLAGTVTLPLAFP